MFLTGFSRKALFLWDIPISLPPFHLHLALCQRVDKNEETETDEKENIEIDGNEETEM